MLVTTAGGIEEDLIKCLGPFYLGDFSLSGKALYKKGLNRLESLYILCNRQEGLWDLENEMERRHVFKYVNFTHIFKHRIGNLLMPDSNYIIFEKWIMPIFKQMLLEQKTKVCALHCEHPHPYQSRVS